jgi:hypothetical protein
MTLDQAKELAAREDASPAERILLARVEALEAVVSDASDLVSRYRASSGNEYYYDVRGRELARVLGRQA